MCVPRSLSAAWLPGRCALLLMLGLLPTARAQIAWNDRVIALRADAASKLLEARFRFSNAGETPVNITQVESSCGCTSVSLARRHYEPRESGEIVARYSVGTPTGALTKTVLVATDDGRPPTTLTLNLVVPEIARMEPASVEWKRGDPPAVRTIVLEFLEDPPAREVTARSSAAGFEVALRPLVAGRKYELTVRPASTGAPQSSTLAIRCRFAQTEREFYAYAAVRPAETKD